MPGEESGSSGLRTVLACRDERPVGYVRGEGALADTPWLSGADEGLMVGR